MSSDYWAILQLRGPVEPDRLTQAYNRSRERFLRLTARGPLRFFRSELLADARRAYQSLRSPSVRLSSRPMSLLSRRVRSVGELRRRGDSSDEKEVTQKALREDAFCREVIYRLEGELIRFDSRRELLQIATEWNIGLFQANMLIAQIAEAVRQHKLYEGSVGATAGQERVKSRWYGVGYILLAGAALAVIIDLLVIGWLGH